MRTLYFPVHYFSSLLYLLSSSPSLLFICFSHLCFFYAGFRCILFNIYSPVGCTGTNIQIQEYVQQDLFKKVTVKTAALLKIPIFELVISQKT